MHIHTPFVAHYAAARFARGAGLPCVATYHTFFEEYLHHYVPVLPRRIGRFMARSFTRSQCADVQALIAPSDPMRDVLLEYGVSTPIHVLPTGLPADRFIPGDAQRFRAQARIPAERPLVTYVGRVAHEKNIEFLVKVFAEVRHTVAGAMLVIAGEGPAREPLRQMVGRLGLERDVHFAGYLDRNTGATGLLRRGECIRVRIAHRDSRSRPARGDGARHAYRLDCRAWHPFGSEGAVAVRWWSRRSCRHFSAAIVRVLQDQNLRSELAERGRTYARTWSSALMARRLADLYESLRASSPGTERVTA